MKKIISMFLALVLCLSLCACGGKNEAQSSKVELNEENILDYLNIEITYTKTGDRNILGNPVMEQTIKIYPMRGGTFENVELLIFERCEEWVAQSSEKSASFVQCDNGYTLTKIKLPSDGNYTCTHKFDAKNGLAKMPFDSDSSKGWEYISLSTVSESMEKWFGSDVVKAGDACIKGSFKEK